MAGHNIFTKDLKEMVTCHICKGILTKPKTLPCLHTLCFKCIQGCYQADQTRNQPFKCPFDNELITEDVENLRASFHHNTLIQKYNDELNEYKRLIHDEREKPLKRWQKKFTKILELSKQERKSFDDEIDLAQQEVRRNTLLQINMLKDHEEAMITSLNDIHTTNKEENDEEESQLNETIQRLENLTNQCQRLEDMNVEEQFNSKEFGEPQLLNDCKSTVREASILYKKPLKLYPSVHYIPNEVAIKSMQDLQFGKVVQSMIDPSRCSIESISQARCGFSNHFSIVTRDTEGDVCYTSKALIDVQIQDIDGSDVHTELTESQTGKYIVKYKAQKPSPYKVVVSIGGEPISNSPQNVETIDAKAEIKPVRAFETTRLSCPNSLAVGNNGEIAVVNNKGGNECRVVLLSADGEYLREFGGGGTGESRLNDPWGVAFNDDRLLVSDNQDGYGCIKEFDIHGNYNRTICKQKEMEFKRLCTTDQTIACLAFDNDSKETFIKLFSKQTDDLLEDIKLDIRVVWIPMFFAYDNHKYFVSFSESHIYVFYENGGLLYTFGEEGDNEGQFNGTCGLAVFGADMLLVCDLNNNRVQLRNQNGQFISFFGSRGKGLGRMKNPRDVVVTPDGQVFVLEQQGKRVQVFR